MKKIQIYVENIKFTEADKQVIILANSLSDFFDITILSFGNIKNEVVLNKKVKLVELGLKEPKGYFDILKLKSNLSKYIKGNKADIIITTSLNINKVLTQVNTDCELIYWRLDDTPLKMEEYKKYLNGFNKIVFTNEKEKSQYQFDKMECILISPAIVSIPLDYDYLDNKNMLYIGALDDENIFRDLLDIMKLVHKDDADVKLKIIGDGSYRTKMMDYCKENNLKDNVEFYGDLELNEIDYEFKRVSLFLNLEDTIMSNIKLIEAMNYGIPSISYYNDTLKNIIENDINGYLIKKNDILDFSNKIVSVFKSDGLLKNMRSCARETSMFYEINSIKSEWLKIL